MKNFEKEYEIVEKTTNYSLFKYLEGNRFVNNSKVNSLMTSIAIGGYISGNHIIVNEKYEIIDGQHRFNALKNLGLVVDYIVKEGWGIKECRILNANGSNWSTSDYVDSYAANKNDNYIKLRNLSQKYRKTPPTIYALLKNEITMSGSSATNPIRSGRLIVTNSDESFISGLCEYLNDFSSIVENNRDVRNELFYTTIGWCSNRKQTDKNRLSKIIKKYGPNYKANCPKTLLELIENSYNKGISPDKWVSYVHEYFKEDEYKKRRKKNDKKNAGQQNQQGVA